VHVIAGHLQLAERKRFEHEHSTRAQRIDNRAGEQDSIEVVENCNYLKSFTRQLKVGEVRNYPINSDARSFGRLGGVSHAGFRDIYRRDVPASHGQFDGGTAKAGCEIERVPGRQTIEVKG
jgi:hypothetical protein